MQEEQRPVLTIVILVSGVVGGLVVVITVVYFYRFCLKKRPPVTTTGKPEHKRDQIRSQAASQCRPLPLPPLVANQPASSVPSHYHNFLPQFEPIPLPSPDKITAVSIDEVNAAEKIAKLFPVKVPVIVATSANENSEPSVYKNERNKQTKGNNYLSVDGAPPRPQSAEMLLTAAEDEERRRASLDAYHRPVRRQLPNIEHLEKVELEKTVDLRTANANDWYRRY
ncbi:hypothetical protein Tcan_15726 [Toxocara canis]|uniref:Uncharacterized protein n=1 Tax=Toxocara canis TaxID=6265 RepID=A0A0B2VLH2_TOXCA|nr:hypothetical protein Tcan_15726 [Toxocara canis]